MAVIKCKMCGGDLNVIEAMSVAECEYCGTKQTVPKVDNEKKLVLFGRANRLRLSNEFDKAAGVYESIIADFPEEAEAYWGLVLCRYGIEYVDDPATGKKIPTCHRSSFVSVMDDTNYEQALENTDVIARKIYREEAKTIEELRKNIVEVSSKEDPYDIFICYKETDEKGNRTIDSALAQDIYDALIGKGYRVFFSRISLEDKLGQEYEPYIFAALNSSKVMLAVGTDYEYFNSVWVKNEWSRFLKLIAAGQKKTLIPVFKNMDAYDMPKEFAKLAAQDMGKVGALQDLLRGVDKILKGTSNKSNDGIEAHLQSQAMAQSDNSIHLGILAVSSGDLDRGIQYFEDALKTNPNHVGAYLGLVWSLPYEKRKPYFERLSAFPLEKIKSFISSNKEMLSSDKTSLLENALHNSGSVELVKTLLESGANAADTYALYYAVISEHRKELVPLLLKHGANPNGEYQLRFDGGIVETRIALADVIWKTGDTELAKLLITNHANVNYVVRSTEDCDYSGNGKKCNWSLLDMAVRKNNESMVRLLLQNGADANSGRWTYRKYWMTQVSSWGREEVFYCALSEAIWSAKNIDIVRLLLENGANPNYQYRDIHQNNMSMYSSFLTDDCSGLYDVICFSDNDEILKLMLRYGADPNTKYRCTWTDWDLNDHVEETSMIDLAKRKHKPSMVETISSYIREKRKIEEINNKLVLLAREQTEIQNRILQIKGLFADTRRKKAETRMAEIKAELIRLEEELKKCQTTCRNT